MNISNTTAIILGSFVCFSANIIAKEITIYRWVDENNVVHFSQNQPRNKNYSELTADSSYRAKVVEPLKSNQAPTTNSQLSQFEKNKAETLAKNKKIAAQNCESARHNKEMLNTLDTVMMLDKEGKNKALSDKEKEAQLRLNQKNISLYCKPENEKKVDMN